MLRRNNRTRRRRGGQESNGGGELFEQCEEKTDTACAPKDPWVNLLGLAKVTPENPVEFSTVECFLFCLNFTSLCTKSLSSHLAGSCSLVLHEWLGAKNLRTRESS